MPGRRLFHGWWIVLTGAVLQLLQGSLLGQAYGSYVVVLSNEFGWSRTVLSGASALREAEGGIVGPVQGWLVDRFDANAYLYITRAMDYFDLAEPHEGQLAGAFARAKDVRFTLVSFDTDWLYPTSESRRIVQALQSVGAAASFVELSAPFGHDSFLLDVPALDRLVAGALRAEG